MTAEITALEIDHLLARLFPIKGEVRLGSRGLYPQTGGGINQPAMDSIDIEQEYSELDVISWLLFMADGENDLVTIAERSGIAYTDLLRVGQILLSKKIIQPVQQIE